MHFKLIIALTEDSITDKIVEAAREKGATGSTPAAPSREVPLSRYSPTKEIGSTIAEAGLNFRVRNGNGCGPRSMESGKTFLSAFHFSGFDNRIARPLGLDTLAGFNLSEFAKASPSLRATASRSLASR